MICLGTEGRYPSNTPVASEQSLTTGVPVYGVMQSLQTEGMKIFAKLGSEGKGQHLFLDAETSNLCI